MAANIRRYVSDSMSGFIEFGLDRDLHVWRRMNTTRHILHLGPGSKLVSGADELDWPDYDFEQPACLGTYGDNSVGGIIATHVLEHLSDPRPLIREAARVLVPGCPFNILVPHGRSNMYLQDMDHKTPLILDSWKLLLENPYYDTNYGDEPIPLTIGANFVFALKDGNEALITQLVKH